MNSTGIGREASTGPISVFPCAGVPISVCSRESAAREVVRLAKSPLSVGVDVHLCNAYTLALADKDPAFLLLLQGAGLNFPDGKAIVWANQLLHRRYKIPSTRIYGPDLFIDVFDLGQRVRLRHYLLGSTPDVVEALEAELRKRFPSVEIVGAESPPFRNQTAVEQDEQLQRLVSSGAEIIWVGLGTPKQDWEVARLAKDVPAVFCAVGAAFDFLGGNKRQAPLWMQNFGLEWLFRLGSEPRRLWKRYLFGNSRFLLAVLRRR